jgi:CheY-like chemotaxis protein
MENVSAKRVLLVIENDDPIREVLTGCFEDMAGWKVIEARSGQEGLTLVLSENPSAIMLDVMMPEMDGITFLQHLQELPKPEAIPVILITAHANGLHLNELANLGVRGIIAKPFDPVLLTQQAAQLLGWDEP